MWLRAPDQGRGPGGCAGPVQYGPRVAAVIIYLYIGQFLSRKRTAQALAELFGIPLSPGTVAGITARAAGKLDGFLERVRENITASDVAGFDETGFRVEGVQNLTFTVPASPSLSPRLPQAARSEFVEGFGAQRRTWTRDGLVHSSQVLRAVAEENDLMLGIYAKVIRPGTVRLGDEVLLMDGLLK